MGVPVVGSMSPWGRVEDVREWGDGVVWVSTAGHAGFWLSADRHRELQSRHAFPTWAGGAWYEEDCDAAVVVVTFSDLFDAPTVERAMTAVLARPAYYGRVSDHWIGVSARVARSACPASDLRSPKPKARRRRSSRDEAADACGLVKVRGALGGVYYE